MQFKGPKLESSPTGQVEQAFEPHFTPQDLGQLWALDETTIRRIFQDEPGVLKIGKSARRDGKRDYLKYQHVSTMEKAHTQMPTQS